MQRSQIKCLISCPLKGVKVSPCEDMLDTFMRNVCCIRQDQAIYASLDFPEDVFLPDLSDRTTMKSSGMLGQKVSFPKYPTVASFTWKSDVRLHHLHPNLPWFL